MIQQLFAVPGYIINHQRSSDLFTFLYSLILSFTFLPPKPIDKNHSDLQHRSSAGARITLEASRKMREVMMSRGHYEGEKSRLLAKFYIFSTVIYIFDTILDIFNLESGQFEEKIFRFKNINMLLCGLAYPLVDTDTYRLLYSIEQQGRFDSSEKSSRAMKNLQEKLDKELDQINKLTYFVIVFIMGTLSIAPLMAAILKIYPKLLTGSGESIDVTKLSLPISLWYPQEYANIYTYILLYTLQIFYIYLFSGYMYCVLTSGFMALKITIYNLKYLCLSVEEGRNRLEELSRENSSFEDQCYLENKLGLEEYIVNIIKLHHMICRSTDNLNRDLKRMYTVWNNTICFQICVCLYSSVKMEDLVLKVEHILLVVPLAYILLLYCSNAQELLNEGENFRTTVWGSFFVDKPKWYKSSMLIMMIRSTKELEIKPFGFYVLNLKTFSMVMKAAYSYFNMLNSLRKRI